ncbi:hypothetical protein ACWD5R_23465 [Streptomyces sp. NPDC002514]|uniref:hypothetical protein n=1 Tax=unclassified Streptomyces TaxID=2593676 RepID=UPI0036752024
MHRLLVTAALVWTAVAGVASVGSVVCSVGAGRTRETVGAWQPYGPDFPVSAVAAVTGYAAGASRFSVGAAAFGVLWPAMAATALAHLARRRGRAWPGWASAVFAAVGAGLYGSLPG